MPAFYADVVLMEQDGAMVPDLPAGVTEFAVVGPGSEKGRVVVETSVKVNTYQSRRKALTGRPEWAHVDVGLGRPDRDKAARDAATAKDRLRPDHPLNRKP